MDKNIQILFFGKLKAVWQTHQLSYTTTVESLDLLYQELLSTAASTPHKDSIKVAINDEFVHWHSAFNDGDVIAFLPPASGG